MPTPKFAFDEIVFAKIKGYAHWPAKVEFYEDSQTTNKVKYNVYFYGTNQIAVCKEEDLFPYIENRDKFGKPKKLKGFMEAISQADSELELRGIGLAVSGRSTEFTPQKVLISVDLNYLSAELKVLKIDLDIKKSLNTDKPNLGTSLKLLDEYAKVTLAPLIFKKNPELISTLTKLLVYSPKVNLGNLLDNKNTDSNESKICLIRKKASEILYKIQSIFMIPQEKSFIELFAKCIIEFQESVKDMPEFELLQLSKDPTVTD